MEDWKIERRKPGCAVCGRGFESEEAHISAIALVEGHFARRDHCLGCWERRESDPFSFWSTRAPKREQKRLEDINAMQEFFRKLLADVSALAAAGDDTRAKVTYLTALLLMRKRRVKMAGHRSHDGRSWLVLEKSWDGDQTEIVEPSISDPEIESLRQEMERLFSLELGQDALARA
jgi:hypothetical protein